MQEEHSNTETNEELSLEELIGALSENPSHAKEFDDTEFKRLILKERAEALALERKGRSEVLEMRRRWSNHLVRLLVALVLFQIGLTIAIGLHLLEFTDYKLVIEIVVGSNFVQIIGLITIVLTFLFSEASKLKDETGK